MDSNDDTVEFKSSELGTIEYWKKSYKRELANFQKHGDIGEIWFGEDSIFRVIKWMKSFNLPQDSSVIDIGCGNGIMLSYLADEGFHNLYGVDYSEEAILLAKGVAEKRNTPIQFEVADILDLNKPKSILNQKFDVVHDKGTFDAISLCPDNSASKMVSYINTVTRLLEERSVYILTSCNWTECELLLKFSQYFEKVATIPTPVFQFGGRSGTTVTCLVFRKKNT